MHTTHNAYSTAPTAEHSCIKGQGFQTIPNGLGGTTLDYVQTYQCPYGRAPHAIPHYCMVIALPFVFVMQGLTNYIYTHNLRNVLCGICNKNTHLSMYHTKHWPLPNSAHLKHALRRRRHARCVSRSILARSRIVERARLLALYLYMAQRTRWMNVSPPERTTHARWLNMTLRTDYIYVLKSAATNQPVQWMRASVVQRLAVARSRISVCVKPRSECVVVFIFMSLGKVRLYSTLGRPVNCTTV